MTETEDPFEGRLVSNCFLEWKDEEESRELEFGRPGRFGVDTRGAATVDASGQTLTPEQEAVLAAATMPSPTPEISANGKQHGAMSNVVQDFPAGRFLMSALAWLALCYHIYLANLGCCAETSFAWTSGTNGGFCTCAGQGVECDGASASWVHNECCMHGSCLKPLNETCEACTTGSCKEMRKTPCPGTCTVIDASELELPARTPKSCTCCMPKMTANGKYDEAGEWMIWSFAIFFVMWYLSFATDLNLSLFTVGTPLVFCITERASPEECRMQRQTTCRDCCGYSCGTRFRFLECDKHDNGSLLRRLGQRAQQHTVAGAEAFTALTRSACEEEPRIFFRNECYHMVRRGKHTVRQITHSAQEHYAAESDESSAPLLPARAGDGWEIPYLNASGEPCVARSRTGLIELRVTLELCFESFDEHTEFSQRFAQFRMDNVHDERQRNWVTAKIDQERVYVCELEEGKRPKCLELRYFYLCSCLALGWLYQVWYDTLTTPVELHLRKTIRKKTFEASGVAQFPDSPPAPAIPVTQEGVDYWSRRLGGRASGGVGRTPAPAAQTMVRKPSEVRVIVETI